jgi:hypothetical protein
MPTVEEAIHHLYSIIVNYRNDHFLANVSYSEFYNWILSINPQLSLRMDK